MVMVLIMIVPGHIFVAEIRRWRCGVHGFVHVSIWRWMEVNGVSKFHGTNYAIIGRISISIERTYHRGNIYRGTYRHDTVVLCVASALNDCRRLYWIRPLPDLHTSNRLHYQIYICLICVIIRHSQNTQGITDVLQPYK